MKSQLLSYLDFQNLVIPEEDVLRYLEDLKNDPAYEAGDRSLHSLLRCERKT